MQPVTLVTAYFDIGRAGFRLLPRTESTYMRHFEFWARIRNPLVVYTQASAADSILEVRDKFGLAELTHIIILDDLKSVEPGIYASMAAIANDKYFRDFRLMPDATSGIADYSYLMLLKTWFVADAVRKDLTNETVAWLDFCFNRGGLVYPNPEEFDFEWTSAPIDRVVLFMMGDYDARPIFEIVRRLSDCIMGAPILIPAAKAEDLWLVNRRAMATLNSTGLMDDDQLVQLLSSRMEPELFELRQSEWFRPLKDVAAPHLTLRPRKLRPWPLQALRNSVHAWRRHELARSNAIRLYRNLLSGKP